jgi:hypothetical protein
LGLEKPNSGLDPGETFFPNSVSDLDSDETFQISRNVGLDIDENVFLLDSQLWHVNRGCGDIAVRLRKNLRVQNCIMIHTANLVRISINAGFIVPSIYCRIAHSVVPAFPVIPGGERGSLVKFFIG